MNVFTLQSTVLGYAIFLWLWCDWALNSRVCWFGWTPFCHVKLPHPAVRDRGSPLFHERACLLHSYLPKWTAYTYDKDAVTLQRPAMWTQDTIIEDANLSSAEKCSYSLMRRSKAGANDANNVRPSCNWTIDIRQGTVPRSAAEPETTIHRKIEPQLPRTPNSVNGHVHLQHAGVAEKTMGVGWLQLHSRRQAPTFQCACTP